MDVEAASYMRIEYFYKYYTVFIQKYKRYFMSNEQWNTPECYDADYVC